MIQRNLISFLLILCNTVFASENDTLHFEWLGERIDGISIEKTAMIIPVQIKNDTNHYYFQFDTGANTSSIYTGTENKLNVAYSPYATTIFGEVHFDSLSYMSPYEEQGKLIIGTIGSDVLQDKIVQIDYLNQEIILFEEVDKSPFNLYAMSFSYGRPVISLRVGKQDYNFMFDTGSSLFDLWSTKKIWKKNRSQTANITEHIIWSWGKQNTIFSSPLAEGNHFFECDNIQINTISYSSSKQHEKIFKQAKVDGIIGNRPFFDNVILLDFKNQTIGIKKCSKQLNKISHQGRN